MTNRTGWSRDVATGKRSAHTGVWTISANNGGAVRGDGRAAMKPNVDMTWRRRTRPVQVAGSVRGRHVDNVLAAVSETFYEFCEMTKVNGLYYLRRGTTTGVKRLIWALIPLPLFAVAIFLGYALWQRYSGAPTRMIIDTPLAILDVPFPAITICHPQSVIDYKALTLSAACE